MSGFQDTAVKSVKQKNKEVLTKEQEIEVIKCAMDPLYFIETYIKVQHPTKGALPLQLYDFQREAIKNFKDYRHNIVLFSRQMGKALDVKTPILTPHGFQPLSNLQIGDHVYGPDGNTTEITYITDTMLNRPCYEIHFSNGETVIADEEHLWSVNVPKKDEPQIITTKELIDQVPKYKKYGQQIHIAHTNEIKFDSKPITDNPYDIGKSYPQSITNITDYIINDKNIRIPLLQGIMSSIGDCNNTGICYVKHSNETVIDTVQFLLQTLGTKSNKTKQKNGFKLQFSETKYDVFKNTFLVQKQHHAKNSKQKNRIYIKTINSVSSVPVKCLTVDNDDSMFLCGNSLIPTHNTTISAAFLLWYATFQKDKTILVVAHNQKGAIEILDRIKYSYKELPFFLKEAVIDFNKTEMKLDNGSRIVCRATSKDASRGLSVSLLFTDELQFVPPSIQAEFYASIRPTLQCVAGDTLVLTQDGYQRIEDLHKGREIGDYFEIPNLETFGKNGMEKVQHGYVQPHSDTMKITTSRGFTVEVTPHHPLYTFAKDGYMGMRRTDELFEGDLLRIQHNMNVFGDNKINVNDAVSTFNNGKFPDEILTACKSDVLEFLNQITINNKVIHSNKKVLGIVQQLFANCGILSTLNDHLEKEQNTTEDFIWDTVESIELQTNKTYDFTVPDTHSFLQNGILGSNTGGAQIITSTPGSDDDLFAQLWRGANDNIMPNGEESDTGKNGYRPVFAKYSDHPDRDEQFAQEERAAMGEEKFLREHENRFISFKETLIDPLVLERLEPKEYLIKTGEVRWFKNIEFDKSYFVCLDPSLGTAQDWQAIQIVEMPTMEHVGEWQSNTTPPKGQVQVLYDILNYIAYELDLDVDDEDLPIYWSFENNGIGEAVLQTIVDSGIENFPGTLISDKKTSKSPRHRKGLNTTAKNKLLACSKFKSLVDTDRFKPRQVGVIKQLKNFTANGASYSAKGQNDDLVMALILAIRMIEMVKSWDIYDPDIISDDIETDFREPLPIVF